MSDTMLFVGSTDECRGFVEAAYAGGAPYEFASIEASGFDSTIVDEIIERDPALVIVGPDIGDDDGTKLIAEVTEVAPHLACILIANPNADLWPQALRAGVRDILAPLAGASAIRESFDRALESGRRLRGTVAAAANTPRATGGRVLTVVSPKGGAGKTTIAANLAATIARQRPDDVVLADLDVQFGDVVHAFRLDPEYSLLHAVAAGISPTVLKGFLTPHPSKVLALAAPDRPEDADDISPEAATETIRHLASSFGCVVVDTAAGLEEHTLSVLDATTDLVLVTSTDVPSVRALVKEMDVLRRLGLTSNLDTHLVLNRSDARVGLSASDIEETLGMPAMMKLPSSRSIPTALNLGEPAVLADERSAVAKLFTKFAQDLGVVPQTQETRVWRIGR